jgi:hypothetical protein
MPPRIVNLPVGRKDRNVEMCKQLLLRGDYQTAVTDTHFVEIRETGKRLDLKQLRFQNQIYNGQDRQLTGVLISP